MANETEKKFPELDVVTDMNGIPGTMGLADMGAHPEIFFLMPSINTTDFKRAKELKKRWNLHDELVDGLQVLSEEIERSGSIIISKTSVIDVVIKNLIEQAEK